MSDGENGAGGEQVMIQVEQAAPPAVDDVQLAAVGLRRPGGDDNIANHAAVARIIFLQSDEPQQAVVYCRVAGCGSSRSKLGDIDYQAAGGPTFASSYGEVSVVIPCIAQCACCHVESVVMDTRRG